MKQKLDFIFGTAITILLNSCQEKQEASASSLENDLFDRIKEQK